MRQAYRGEVVSMKLLHAGHTYLKHLAPLALRHLSGRMRRPPQRRHAHSPNGAAHEVGLGIDYRYGFAVAEHLVDVLPYRRVQKMFWKPPRTHSFCTYHVGVFFLSLSLTCSLAPIRPKMEVCMVKKIHRKQTRYVNTSPYVHTLATHASGLATHAGRNPVQSHRFRVIRQYPLLRATT